MVIEELNLKVKLYNLLKQCKMKYIDEIDFLVLRATGLTQEELYEIYNEIERLKKENSILSKLECDDKIKGKLECLHIVTIEQIKRNNLTVYLSESELENLQDGVLIYQNELSH